MAPNGHKIGLSPFRESQFLAPRSLRQHLTLGGMGIPILISRSGFTAWGVELARKSNLTLIGRARGKRFVALAGEDRIVFDQDLTAVEEESAKHRRKAAMHDD